MFLRSPHKILPLLKLKMQTALVLDIGRRVTVSEPKTAEDTKMVSAVGAEQAPMSDTQLPSAELTNCRIASFVTVIQF